MRSEIQLCWAVITTGICINLQAGLTDSRALWEEVNFRDYGWASVKVYDDNESIMNIGCFARLPRESIGHTYRLNLNTRNKLPCIVELPGSTNLQFLSINLHRPKGFIRILTGHSHNRPVVGSKKIKNNAPLDQIYGVDCNYGFMFVRNDSPEDSIVFYLSDRLFEPDDGMYVTEDECNAPAK